MIGLGPFTMQVLVPSLPAMGEDMGVSTALVQLTVTFYLLAVACGQLVYGPLSDRFGRRPLLMMGLALYALASLLGAVADGIGMLVAARILQAAGACAGVVLARAVIRDSWPREESASVLGYVTMGMTIAPMVAPVLGSVLEEAFGWRATMWACLGFGLPLAAIAFARLPETLPAPQPLPGLGAVWAAYANLWALPLFRAYCGVTAFSTGIFFAFLGGAPYVVVQGMGYSPVTFALAFAVMSILFAMGNFLAGRWSRRLGVARMLTIGTLTTTSGAVLAGAAVLLLPAHIATFFVPMGLVALGNGMVQPNAIAGALSVRPAWAGTASALVGFLQMGFGGLATFLVGLVESGSGLGSSLCMTAIGIACFVALLDVRRYSSAN
jgi:DHA1 family bicyclomycin/chloramphenicol resistance-like MFS transporter